MFMRRILVSYTSWNLYDIGYYNLSKYASGKVVLILKCRQETLFEFETWLSSGEQRKSGHFPVHQRYCNTFQAWFVRTNWGWPRGDARCRLHAAVVRSCLRESWRAQKNRHGLCGFTPRHICHTPRCGHRPLAPDVGDHCAILSRRQGAGLPRLCEAVYPRKLHRSSAKRLPVCPAAVHGADRWVALVGR